MIYFIFKFDVLFKLIILMFHKIDKKLIENKIKIKNNYYK